MSWPVAKIVMGDVPGLGRSFILKGAADDHVPRPPRTEEASRVMREMRAQAKVEGRCIVCTRSPAKPDCSSCIGCLDARSQRQDDARERRWRTGRNTNGARAGAREGR